MATKFNAITLEMLWTRLISIVDEAAAAMVRTLFSTVVRERNDFACVLTDERGLSLVQATESIPSFIGTVPRTVKHSSGLSARTAQAGRHPDHQRHLAGHRPPARYHLAKPISATASWSAFSATTAHAPDIGGKIRSPRAARGLRGGPADPADEDDRAPARPTRRWSPSSARTCACPTRRWAICTRSSWRSTLMEDASCAPDGGTSCPILTDLGARNPGRAARRRCAPRSAKCPMASIARGSSRPTADGRADQARDGAHHQGR